MNFQTILTFQFDVLVINCVLLRRFEKFVGVQVWKRERLTLMYLCLSLGMFVVVDELNIIIS